MNIKGFIFDLDGVIVFTDQYHYLAWKEMADELGVYFDEEINNRLRGVSRMDSLEIILENYHGKPLTPEEKAALATKKNEAYRKLLSTMTREDVSPEVRQTLQKLHEKGYKIALGSSSKNAKYILEKVELLDAFDAISDGTNITYSKPHPEVFLKAADYIDLDPRDCAVVEDATSGIDAAKAGSMVAVAIGDATSYDKADYCIERFDELLELC
jgi:beta-phosphoglucomutase